MKKIVFPFLVLLFLVFVSCEEDEELETYYVGELEKYIPFEGGEQLHYLVNGTEKIVLSASEKSSIMFPSTSGNSEQLSIGLGDSIGDYVFGVSLFAGSGGDPFMMLNMNFKDYENSNGSVLFQHSFSGQHFDSKILESLKVGDKTYHDVIEAKYCCDSYSKLYYCASDGIIKSQGIKSTWINDGNAQVHDTIVYELEKIEWN